MRDLRGQRAEDLIYAGPRSQLGAAEVVLTFEHDQPEPGEQAEQSVGRRLYRSGESEYLVDGRRCRLRDVLDVLRRLGIDGGQHVVVNQGMADALLSATSAERRGLLEQAAGLAGYRTRRDEARQKLATTEQNVLTIEAVLAEMEPHLRMLKRQARAVLDRDQAQQALGAALECYYASGWHQSGAALELLSAAAVAAAQQRKHAASTLARVEAEVESQLGAERSWQGRMDAAIAEAHRAEREEDAARHILAQLEQSLAQDRRTTVQLDARRQELLKDARDAEQHRATAEEAANLLKEEEGELRRAESAAEQLAQQLSIDAPGVQNAATEAEAMVGSARELHDRLTAEEMRLNARLDAEQQQAQHIRALVNECATTMSDLEREEAYLAERMHIAGEEETAAAAMAAQAAAGQAQAKQRQVRLELILSRTRARADDARRALEQLGRRLEQLENAVSGTLLAGLTVSPDWEEAVSAVLGNWSTSSAADGGITQLWPGVDQEFLSWREKLDLSHPADVASTWADAVVSGPAVEQTGLFYGALFVQSEVRAQAIWHWLRRQPACRVGSPVVCVVTQTGLRIDGNGVMGPVADDRAASYLRLKSRFSSLHREREVLQARKARLEAAVQRQSTLATKREETNRKQDDVLQSTRETRARLSHSIANLARRRAAVLADRDARRSQLEKLERNADEAVRQRADLELELSRCNRSLDAAMTHWRSANELLTNLRDRVDAALRKSYEARHEREAHTERLESRRQQVSATVRSLRRLNEEVAGLAAESEAVARSIANREAEVRRHAGLVAELETRTLYRGRQADAVRSSRPPVTGHTSVMRPARASLSQAIADDERLRLLLSQAEQECAQLAAEIEAETGQSASTLQPSQDPVPTAEEIKRLRSRATQYADADASVVTESAELTNRSAYLRNHVEDLRTAADTLRAIMDTADREMHDRFQVAFDAVNAEFSRVFEVMLRGGHGCLQQVEAESGVEIDAHLPGRRSRASVAFSGGERALVASSLLFGVLKIRPTPFCILDEVDAALDESNVDRYLMALRDIGRNTQVIVVTHNRATMAAADILYGMTMESEGISRALSLRLDANQAVG